MVRSLHGNAAWQLVQTVASTGTELVILLVFAAQTSPQAFGALAVALSGAKLVFLLFEARIHEFLTPKLARYLHRRSDAAWQWTLWSRLTEFRLNLFAVAVCIGIAFVLPAFSSAVSPALFAAASLYVFVNTAMKFSSLAIFRCLGEIRVAATIAFWGGIGKLAVLGVCSAAGSDTTTTLYIMCLPAAAAGLALANLAAHRMRARLGPPRRRAVRALREANRYRQRHMLLSNYATGLVEIGHRELDVQIVAWLIGTAESGRYRLAKTLAMFVLEALNPIVLVLLPDLARRLASPGREQLRAFIRRVTVAFAGIGTVAVLVVTGAAALYLQLLAPAQQAAWAPAVTLAIGFGALAPTMWAQAYLVAVGRPQAYLWGSLAGAMTAVLLALVLVRPFGATGAAVAHVGGLALTCANAWLCAHWHLRG